MAPTEKELRDYCTEHASTIYVRVREDRHGVTKTLADLPAEEREAFIEDWMEGGMYPHRKVGPVAPVNTYAVSAK